MGQYIFNIGVAVQIGTPKPVSGSFGVNVANSHERIPRSPQFGIVLVDLPTSYF
jgi:hypothetical protein